MRDSCLKAGRARLPALLLCAGLAAGSPAFAVDQARLEVLDADGERLVSVPMPEGEGWCLEWNHSVEGFPVLDCYRHREGRMVLERSHLPDFAAGLDHIPGRGRQVSDGEGGYWIEAIDEPVPGNAYRLRVGALRVDHRLVIDGTRVSLSGLAENRRVTIRLTLPAASPD
ncbi:DUF1850 domain-containing protein [Halomonas rhizosphaerae]|uniref:DUF1850 domain-containing protein n=1 Tax=Halomonas rhizosphaerae TaxID=3043296 RepID=A0ABT6UZ61_9GAMM|nr:DUF1850 domain-containing protein [Halomonas rhizosphaerae]MDI5891263.1 DUF1850 domain-containing protein [Halomonas rhizosphaerae]MDI5921302.1 DUF1850 domain-containing protein [Halomonas rhizosphaerae]